MKKFLLLLLPCSLLAAAPASRPNLVLLLADDLGWSDLGCYGGEIRSLLPALADQPIPRTAPLFFEHDGSRAVRDGQWKLVSVVGDAWELYDLQSDPTEMRALASAQPERVRALAAKWAEWAQRARVDASVNPFARNPPKRR